MIISLKKRRFEEFEFYKSEKHQEHRKKKKEDFKICLTWETVGGNEAGLGAQFKIYKTSSVGKGERTGHEIQRTIYMFVNKGGKRSLLKRQPAARSRERKKKEVDSAAVA